MRRNGNGPKLPGRSRKKPTGSRKAKKISRITWKAKMAPGSRTGVKKQWGTHNEKKGAKATT